MSLKAIEPDKSELVGEIRRLLADAESGKIRHLAFLAYYDNDDIEFNRGGPLKLRSSEVIGQLFIAMMAEHNGRVDAP